MQNNKQQNAPTTKTDSLFGMALAQAFMGGIFGAGVSMAWECAEMASSVRDDRMTTRSAGPQTSFTLNNKHSLGDFFSKSAFGTQTVAPSAPAWPSATPPNPSSFSYAMAA